MCTSENIEIKAVNRKNELFVRPIDIVLPEVGLASVVFHVNYSDARLYTFCVIRAKKCARLTMGVAIKHPGDQIDYRKGRLVAFGRALSEFYPHVTRNVIGEFTSPAVKNLYTVRRDDAIMRRREVWKQILDQGV